MSQSPTTDCEKQHCPVPQDEIIQTKQRQQSDDVYLLARVSAEYASELRNSLVKVVRIVPNYGGRIVGIANRVNVLENGLSASTWSLPKCMLVLQFPSRELAERWSYSDPVFRNKDFPSPCSSLEMIIVPMVYIPSADFKTFQITTFKVALEDVERFQTDYIDAVAKFYEKHDVCYGVSMTRNIHDVRFGWVGKNEYISIHTFPNEELLNTLYNDSEYEKLKAVMNCLSVSSTIAFVVQ